MYFEMANGTFRIIGTISSAGQPLLKLPEHPTEEVFYWGVNLTPTPAYLRWIETNTARDITTCHTWNGTTNEWDFSGGGGCGAGYDATPVGGPSTTWSSTSTGVTACSASDIKTTETACAGWTGSPVTGVTSQSNANGLVQLALNGSITTMAMFEATGLAEIYGSVGNDTLSGSLVADEVFLGEGDDVLLDASRGNDQIHAGPGDDEIHGGADDDILHGSFGQDLVYGDGGADTIVILGVCEVEAGEVYDGGSGTDTLYSPLTVLQLQALGVTVQNFESVVTTHADAQFAACSADPYMTEVRAHGSRG